MSDEPQPLQPHYGWHDSQWQHMVDLHEKQRLPHAVLFAGPEGVGKLRFAKALAYSLLCEQATLATACGKCKSCHLNESSHPDLKLIEPEEGARQIKVDQVRGVVDFIAQTSHAGGYKITIIAPAEAMNINAANAILKNLEEPTENSLLILISDAPGTLMPTIRSRCQQLYFPVPQQEQVLPWLTSATANPALAQQLLDEAGGKPILALDYLNSGALQKYQDMEQQLLEALNQRMQPLTLADKWKDHALLDILHWLQNKLAQLIRAEQAGAELSEAWQPWLVTPAVNLFGLLDEVQALAAKVQRGANPNRQLVVEDLLLKCCATLKR
ncbi:DNA polymerase III subunit delta' [Dasania sp. GY-MA-18]|uniref:DNA-directed DNA polymerase n=1 Tax=Dasania phycosphaerae TaxID=2950436 RepID=A0A9J6RJI8_9GAMM|nr:MULTISPECIES: DNA polymerase III subunit delta' [Dasania]MCR8921939.1 DNA polymerase III subunit delta' [Dasania sp. GY-MA-18]MCZ0864367.1 DNA polymerase III subunit delta' [Dasania phycosphaerae]MCZ0868095.1 DNA polymerase III subunit delta' [Dasania phycosphaerae]